MDSYYDEEYVDPNNRELQREFAEEYTTGARDQKVLLDLAKHSSTYSLYAITRFLQYRKAILVQKMNKSKKEPDPKLKEEIDFIDKTQYKVTPIFMKKWLDKCVDRRIIFDYIKLVELDDKQKQLVNETIASIHSIGYIKHFLETVDFADKNYVETRIKNGSDYCLKYEYGLHYPKARKAIIAAMRQQAERQKEHAGIIKYYADELKEMKMTPTTEEAKML